MARTNINRVILIVLDSVGAGELPDAAHYGDQGSNTLAHTAAHIGGLQLPNLARLGLGHIIPILGVEAVVSPIGGYGKMQEQSAGKDTTTGHWEIGGVILTKPFPTYPHGFPKEVVAAFVEATGTDILGNKVASGTEIIQELGALHVETGKPIVYTSADSVFQIAAHESVIPLAELYSMCQTARDILQGEYAVGRVIARPFTGSLGEFQRTTNRRDFSLAPVRPTILEVLVEAGLEVSAVGKISDIFAGQGITRSAHTHGNDEAVDATLSYIRDEDGTGLIFANLVDFDMLWGHRNDVEAYGKGLEAFDRRLPALMDGMHLDDLLIITADHGCDPTTPSTDHSREYVPLLVWSPTSQRGVNLGIRSTFADVAATIAEAFDVHNPGPGRSFLPECLLGVKRS